MIANIKVAFDMLFYETYGVRYFDTNMKPVINHKHKQEITKDEQTGIELVPIDEPDDMPF